MSKFLTVAKITLIPRLKRSFQNRLSHMETCVAECDLRELKGAFTQVIKNLKGIGADAKCRSDLIW